MHPVDTWGFWQLLCLSFIRLFVSMKSVFGSFVKGTIQIGIVTIVYLSFTAFRHERRTSLHTNTPCSDVASCPPSEGPCDHHVARRGHGSLCQRGEEAGRATAAQTNSS